MSGFAVLVQSNSSPQEREAAFEDFLQLVMEYKHLDLPAERAVGKHCTAAKLDSSSSLHLGISRDEKTGSWLLATGTVVSLDQDNNQDPALDCLLRDYLEHGVHALQWYDGHFALVIYDARTMCLSVISDPIGHFSIFYGSQGNRTFISSSALAVARQICSPPDVLTIDCFLRTEMAYGDKTLWQDVKRLLPATVFSFVDGRVEACQYWAPTVDETIAKLSLDEAIEQAVEMLSHTFKRLLRREGRVWADLTGGFDSRLSTTIMAKLGIPFITYCVGPSGNPDVRISKLISREMGWNYRHFTLPDEWEPEQYAWFETALCKGDGNVGVLSLASVLRGHLERSAMCKAHVLGLGGEDWRGYYWLRELHHIGRTCQVNYQALLDRIFAYSIPASTLRKDRTREVCDDLRRYIEQLTSRDPELPNTVKLDTYSIRSHTAHGGAFLSAASGIMRSLIPLCFKEPTNFALSLNYKWKLPYHHHFFRVLLERMSAQVANITTEKGGPAVPMRVTNLPRFWPLYKQFLNQAVQRGSCKLFRKPITLWPRPNYPSYPLPAWQAALLKYASAQGFAKPSTMYSGALYNAGPLGDLISQANTEGFKHGDFLDRLITVEMALRTVGVGVE